jgi:YVTN family beta-propeller protein
MSPALRLILGSIAVAVSSLAHAGADGFVHWESPQSHPLELTPSGGVLLAVNTADGQLEVFDVVKGLPRRRGSVAVGLDPVSVRARSETEAWVVNQISDSVSVVDLPSMRVTRTILVGDEPADVVFAGSPERAFVSLARPSQLAVTISRPSRRRSRWFPSPGRRRGRSRPIRPAPRCTWRSSSRATERRSCRGRR